MLSQKIIVRQKIIENMLLIKHIYISPEKVYCTKTSDVNELKRLINSKWAALSHTVIECAVVELHQGLRACVRTAGGHFESRDVVLGTCT